MTGFLDAQTVVLLVVGGALMYGVFTWTADYIDNARETSEERRESITKCSELQIDYVDREKENGTTTVFFTVNRPLEALKVDFRGSGNSTSILDNVEENTVYSASTDVANVSEIETTSKECSEIAN